ncbi:MAG: hypothetical protein ACFB20_02215 [Opitutales bacterium]
MERYLYFSMIPESLIASMLRPDAFGAYFATGTQRRSRGRAIFVEVDAAKIDDSYFPLKSIEERCVPHEDGRPRKSTYLSIYRVLEHLPLEALGRLYLVTDDGRTLGIDPKPYEPAEEPPLHLYQEFCPVTPQVASKDDPRSFIRNITDRSTPVSVKTIAFCELKLEGLATDPETATADNLPYPNIAHLRDCLVGLKNDPDKRTKAVIRGMRQEVLYRTIKNGLFIGEGDHVLYYPLPSLEHLEREHYEWWRSAQAAFG